MHSELRYLIEGAVEADSHGFSALLIPDHYMWGRGEDKTETLESWTTLSYLAAMTQRIMLGTLVTPIPFRPPGMLAKIVSTLDQLSKGRVIMGVGAGWSRAEFEGYSEWSDDGTRVARTEEGLELIIRLWREDLVDFEGKYYKAKGAELKPKPVQKPYPKLLFGTRSPRMLKLAGKYADLCHLDFPRTLEEFETAKTLLMEAAEENGRKGMIEIVYGSLWPSKYDTKEFAEKVEEAERMGASYFIAAISEDSNFKKNIGLFEKEIISSFSSRAGRG